MGQTIKEAYLGMHRSQRKKTLLEDVKEIPYKLGDVVRLNKSYHGVDSGTQGTIVDILDNNYIISEFKTPEGDIFRLGFSPIELGSVLSLAA